ncbi:MAG TPA: carboxypeptidase regulatory-like domain-containing protein, partial [Flavisolibacter sp.]|nr:carboxypeptidase regulatory-like domain-containing protein [Flavisolibacter sp.]
MKRRSVLKLQMTWWLFGLLALLLFSQTTIAQQINTLSGKVVNEKGEPLSSVTVQAVSLDGRETHTVVSDSKGFFSFRKLNVRSPYNLTASYVGYKSRTIKLDGTNGVTNNSIIFNLEPSTNQLDQVVVIGYGTQKREMVTGSIATIKAENFNRGVISDPLTLISGKVAGLAITRPNGADPNASADFSLRGAVSVEGNSQPLIVIDGVPGGDINTIAPADIASIDVLRDGSAASIYGSRATSGVIIITTKKGTAGPTKVNYNGYIATEKVAKKYNVLNSAQYKKFALDNGLASNDQHGNTDWFNQLTRTPFSHGHNLSFNGGDGRTNYNASLNYQRFQGIDISSDREFINGTLLLNTKAINDKLDISLFLANSFENKYYAEYYGFGQALVMNPTYPVFDSTGNYFET